jgi:large repetitive protein
MAWHLTAHHFQPIQAARSLATLIQHVKPYWAVFCLVAMSMLSGFSHAASIPTNVTIDFDSAGFTNYAEHPSSTFTAGDITITYTAYEWVQRTNAGESGTPALQAGLFSGDTETVIVQTTSGNLFDFVSFYYGKIDGDIALIRGYRNWVEVASMTPSTGSGTKSLSSAFDSVDRVVIYSTGSGFNDIFDSFILHTAAASDATLTSATYSTSAGTLVVTGTNFAATSGASNDVVANKFTLTGEGGSTYTLTDTANVEISSATSFTLVLSATDRAGVNILTNKNGSSSTDGTSYNLAGAAGFIAAEPATADLTANSITVSNVSLPIISSAAYNASTGVLTVTGTGFTKRAGANNDIVANKFTLYGEGGNSYTLTDTSNIEITSYTSFALTLSATDKEAYNLIANKNGGVSTDISTFYLEAADDWAAGADPAIDIEDSSGNNITVSNVAIPTITSSTYNFSTGVLVVAGNGYLSRQGATNDVVANKFTFTGQGGATYTLTDTANVDVSSSTSFTMTLSATDKTGVNSLLNNNGTSAQDSTTYNLAAADDWAAGADAALNVADVAGNGITASNVMTLPGAPAIGTATAGDTQASVTFSAPSSDGGSAITSYTATASPGGATASGAGSPLTITGLTNGVAYTVTVTATNGVGTSPASAASNSVTPKATQTITFNNPGAQNFGTTPTLSATSDSGLTPLFTSATTGVCTITSGGSLTFVAAGTCTIDADQAGNASYSAAPTVSQSFSVNAVVPGAPTAASATAGDTQAAVSFTAPTFTGGAAITSYTATSSPGGFTGTAAGSPITVTGLTNGVAYSFTVTATNSAGTGSASAASNTVTPAATQTITFNNPGAQSFGTTPTLTATSDSGLTVSFTSSTTGVCTVTSGGALTFASAGTCTINADQAGNASYFAAPTVSQSFNVNAVVPGAPTTASATAGDTQASVSFSAPAFTGGAAITGYTVTSTPGGLTATGAASPLTVTGLTNGVSYTFTVTATNSAGTGSASAASNAAVPKATQTITFANPGAQNFGTAPTLTATADSGLTPVFTSATTGVCTITSGGELTFVATGTCTINANEAGNGTYLPAAQVSRSFVVNATAPNAPTIGTATAGSSQATVNFVAPTNTGGATITGYTATSNPGGLTASGAASPLTVTGLTNGTAYTFSVTATNSAGASAPSANSNSVTPLAENSAPTISGSPLPRVDMDTAYSFTPTANDADADTLTFSIVNKPGWATFDTATGALTGTPPRSAVGVTDGIVITVSDGTLSASLPAFTLEVIATNQAPVAVDDSFTLQFSMTNTYLLNVLSNDKDADNDSLTITASKASIGQVQVQDNQLRFTAPDNFNGTTTLSYRITDGEFSDSANVTLTINGANANAPVITVPDDISVNANGLFTKVKPGVARAVDSSGNRLAVSLLNGIPLFAPGLHQIYWQATDANGLTSTKAQQLMVWPQVSLSKPQTVFNHSSVTVDVYLNGPAPAYPLDIAFTVSGTASAPLEHDLMSGVVQITSGTHASITFNVSANLTDIAEKNIVVTLADSINRGANASTEITVTEANLAPVINLSASQHGIKRLIFGKADGQVSIQAQVTDPNPNDSITLQWQADTALVNLASGNQFVFDPAMLNEGVYRVMLTATDDATPALSSSAEVYLQVRSSLPVLDMADSNNNMIPDIIEGLGDANGNGIPDYLDPGFDCNVIPMQLASTTAFVAEGEPGLCLRKGAAAALSSSGGIELTRQDQQWLEPDMQASHNGGVFDFILLNLPAKGASYSLVLPQKQPVPANAVYRKLTAAKGWTDFVSDSRNRVFSSAGEPGYCPPPGAGSWQSGLIAGYWCVQLQIEDGGPNDADGLANGTIVDPGSVAVPLSSNSQPQAVNDSYQLQWNQPHQLRVLDNDTDADGDTLSINQASAAFGTVSINADSNTLWYTPDTDFVGSDTLSYSVNDEKGGSASATVALTVYYNRAPVVTNSTTSTNDRTAIDINVLANASDADGDTLSISQAVATEGTVSIINGTMLRYVPKAGFDGIDRIGFTLSDGRGGLTQGEVRVTVTAFEVITVTNTSSGGSGSGWPLALLTLLVAIRRRNVIALALTTLPGIISFGAQAAWSVDGLYGHSKAKQSANTISAKLPAGAEIVQYDSSAQSWALGINYHYSSALSMQVHYVDLGETSLTLRADTLTPNEFYQAVSTLGPMQADGIRSGLSYQIWQHSNWSATVQAGLFFWQSNSSSTAGNNVTRFSENDTDAYWGLSGGYRLNQQVILQCSFSRYQLDDNKVDSVMLGVNYAF